MPLRNNPNSVLLSPCPRMDSLVAWAMEELELVPAELDRFHRWYTNFPRTPHQWVLPTFHNCLDLSYTTPHLARHHHILNWPLFRRDPNCNIRRMRSEGMGMLSGAGGDGLLRAIRASSFVTLSL